MGHVRGAPHGEAVFRDQYRSVGCARVPRMSLLWQGVYTQRLSQLYVPISTDICTDIQGACLTLAGCLYAEAASAH
jgi:hypothetical protein